jgi:tetratricopeptide (TPR) repeat protein
MRHGSYLLLFAAVFLSLSAPPAYAQLLVRTVHLPEVIMTASPTEDERKIAQTAANVLDLRLSSMKQIKVVRGKACDSTETRTSNQSREESPGQMALADPATAIYEVSTSIKALTVSGSANSNVELVLDYDLVRYVRCKPTSVIHRSEPISLKTAFEALLQMGDVIDVALTKDLEELAPPKLVVDLTEITGGGDSLREVREQLGDTVFFKLGIQPDFRALDSRGRSPDSQSDYTVTAELLTKDQKGVRFTVKSVKDNKTEKFSVSGPVGQKNPDDKVMAAFYEKAAGMVVNYIRARRDNVGPLSDADVEAISQRASKLLCKDSAPPGDCVSAPVVVIPLLTRLRDADKASPKTLELLGDAYAEVEEYQKAAEAYEQALMKQPNGGNDSAAVALMERTAETLNKARLYFSAAGLYGRAIDASLKLQLPLTANTFVQYARSYRFAGYSNSALDAVLSGLRRFPDSAELDAELVDILETIGDTALLGAYESLMKYRDIEKVSQKLPDLKQNLAAELISNAFENALSRTDLAGVDRTLKSVETLGLESLPQEERTAYTVARALWLRESKSDFDGAIAMLTPYAAGNSEEADTARLFLVDTIYEKALQKSSALNRPEYERAVGVVKRILRESGDSLLYAYIVVLNHDLGKDQESREILEGRLSVKNDDSRAIQALASLCIEYLNDLDCAEKHIRTLAGLNKLGFDIQLKNTLLQLLRRQYVEADELLGNILLANRGSIDSGVTTVALLYRVWLRLALGRDAEAEAAAREWQVAMEKLRSVSIPRRRILQGASRGIEAEQIPPDKKELLRRMIAAMVDPQQPLPKLTDFFPATRR